MDGRLRAYLRAEVDRRRRQRLHEQRRVWLQAHGPRAVGAKGKYGQRQAA